MSGICPGNTQALGDVDRLASAGEWTALALLPSVANRPDAVGALAAAADKEPAFRWMWAIVNSGGQPQYWQQVSAKLASGIKVPENLRDDVRRFILNPPPQQALTTYQTYQQPGVHRDLPSLRRGRMRGGSFRVMETRHR